MAGPGRRERPLAGSRRRTVRGWAPPVGVASDGALDGSVQGRDAERHDDVEAGCDERKGGRFEAVRADGQTVDDQEDARQGSRDTGQADTGAEVPEVSLAQQACSERQQR